MKENLLALNSLLFEQMERLSNDDLREDELAQEIKRSNAIANIAKNIIDTGSLALNVAKFREQTCVDENNAIVSNLIGE